MAELREIHRRDFESVNRIWGEHVAGVRRREGWESPSAPALRPQVLEMYASLVPSACLVAEEEGRVAGFAFCRLWGRTGWIGPWGVEASSQGQGLGRALVERAGAALADAGAVTIGLETDPGGTREIGLLARCGFRPSTLVLAMEKVLPEGAGDPGVPEEGTALRFLAGLLPEERAPFLEKARRLSASLDADLDLSPEIGLLEEYGLGDAIFAERDGEAVGMALCVSRPLTGEEDDSLRVQAMVLAEPEPFRSLDFLLRGIEVFAHESRLRRVRLHAPARSWEGCRAVLERGYRVTRTFLRLHRIGFPEKGEGRMVHFARWQ